MSEDNEHQIILAEEQVDLWESETKLNQEKLKKAKLDTKRAKIEYERLKRVDDVEQLSDFHYRTRFFESQVDKNTARKLIGDLITWYREDPDRPVRIVFNSPGGSVFEGLAVVDTIRDLRDKGLRIDTHTIGMAASMGGILLQAGEHRSAGRYSYMLVHEVSSGIIGSASDIKDQAAFVERLQSQLLDILAERSTLSKKEIRKRWERKDWWLDAGEMLEAGFVDEVV